MSQTTHSFPMSNSFAPRVVTAGEALIDLVSQPDGNFQPCLGGAVFNLSRALARQNVSTLYQNPLSSDRFGRQLAQALQDDGVQLALANPVAQTTSLAVVALNDKGHPDYAFYREGVADRQITAASMKCCLRSQCAVGDCVHRLFGLGPRRRNTLLAMAHSAKGSRALDRGGCQFATVCHARSGEVPSTCFGNGQTGRCLEGQ